MSQGDIINILEREKRWMTAQEISDMIKVSPKGVRMSLGRLFKHQEVRRKRVPTGRGYSNYLWRLI